MDGPSGGHYLPFRSWAIVIVGILTPIVMSWLVRQQKANSILKGAQIGLMVWLGFALPVMVCAPNYYIGWFIIIFLTIKDMMMLVIMGAVFGHSLSRR